MKKIIFITVLLQTLVGCDSNNNFDSGLNNESQKTNFTEFVKNRINETSETVRPVDISNIEFSYTENEDAFGMLFDQ